MAGVPSRGGTQRALRKLEADIQEGRYYEAHQMYRTLHFRLVNQQKYAEAIDLLYEGAVKLLTKSQFSSGADLAILIIQLLDKTKSKVTNDLIGRLVHLHSLISPKTIERQLMVISAVKWSSHGTDNSTGDPILHQYLGLNYWKEENYYRARYHFVNSQDGEAYGWMLIDFHLALGFPSEVDLFIAQACLQLLCLNKKSTAHNCFHVYTDEHPHIERGPPFMRPLLNFIWFLLLAVEGGKVAVFTLLCEKYHATILRDPVYLQYLDRIGQIFFGVPAPAPQQGGLFGNILQGLLAPDDVSPAPTKMSAEDVD